MSVWKSTFGQLANGKNVAAWHVQSGNIQATLLEYGATVQSLLVPAKDGRLVDVVLGYDTPEEYVANTCFFGAVIGRVANRIGGAAFSLGGKTYSLVRNNGENHLHGGTCGFDRRVWQGEAVGENAVRFSRLSPDGEEGYPGNLQVQVTYTLSDGGLFIDYEAQTDADTPVVLTNHSYFNLNGHGSVLEHTLFVAAERFTENDAGCLPTGRILPVAGTPFDFRRAKKIGLDIDAEDAQLRYGGGYDHNFILTGAADAAVLTGDCSGIRMTMRTDMPGVQVYSGNNIVPHGGKGGVSYSRRDALCLETQLFPNALRCYGFPSPILHAGELLKTQTAYLFDTV